MEGAKLEDLSNPPMQIGYRHGNLELAQSICRLIPEEQWIKPINLPEHVFSQIPDDWRCVLPNPTLLQKSGN